MRLVPTENGVSGAPVLKIWPNKLKLLPPDWWISFASNATAASAPSAAVRCSALSSSRGPVQRLGGPTATSEKLVSTCRIKNTLACSRGQLERSSEGSTFFFHVEQVLLVSLQFLSKC